MISNSGHDERGKYKGGKAGDQTGQEWCIRSWYNRPWTHCIVFEDVKIREALCQLSIEAANNNYVGYDQDDRYTYWYALKDAGFRPKNIKVKCEADCSAGVGANVKAVGYLLNIQKLKDIPIGMYTGNEIEVFKKAGAKIYTDKKYLTSEKHLKDGYILLYENHHTCVFVGDGKHTHTIGKVGTTEGTSTAILRKGDNGSAVEIMQKMLIACGYSCGSYGADGDFGGDTEKTLKRFQKDYGLDVDGEYGPISKKKLEELYNVLSKSEDVIIDVQNTPFKKYVLTNVQVRGLASLCLQEQGTLKGVMYEASLMANLFEKQTKYKTLVDYVLKSGWFAKAETYYNKMNAETTYQDAVKKVLCDGIRVLPVWVDEHDCFSDIKSATNNGKSIAKTDRSSYKKGVTVIKNNYGSTYTFYGFADSKSDPFGAIKWGADDTHYDFNGNLIRGTSNTTDNKSEESNNKLNTTEKWIGKVTASALNVRSWAGTENSLCSFGPLKNGVKVSVCDTVKDSKKADWYYVRYNGKYGFVYAEHIKKI